MVFLSFILENINIFHQVNSNRNVKHKNECFLGTVVGDINLGFNSSKKNLHVHNVHYSVSLSLRVFYSLRREEYNPIFCVLERC
jgi:hypothetical protein